MKKHLTNQSRPMAATTSQVAGREGFILPVVIFALTIMSLLAVVSLNTALMRGQIVTAVPIVACSPVFTMLLSVLVFRREKLTPRIVLATFVVVPSVVLIALSS